MTMMTTGLAGVIVAVIKMMMMKIITNMA